MTRFRYDAILWVGSEPAPGRIRGIEGTGLTREGLEAMLVDGPDIVTIRSVPNERIQRFTRSRRRALWGRHQYGPAPRGRARDRDAGRLLR